MYIYTSILLSGIRFCNVISNSFVIMKLIISYLLASPSPSPSPTIGKSLSQSDRLKLLKAVRDKKMSMETAIRLVT